MPEESCLYGSADILAGLHKQIHFLLVGQLRVLGRGDEPILDAHGHVALIVAVSGDLVVVQLD